MDAPIPISVHVGELEAISSGIVMVSAERQLAITIGGLQFRFVFTEDETGESRWEGKADGKTMNLKFFNFSNGLGEGVMVPTKVGTIRGRDLLLTMFVYTPDAKEGRRIVHYTVYLGGAS